MGMQPQEWTVNSLATELGIDRRTIASRLAAANVKPVRTDKRSSFYAMKDAAPACVVPVKGNMEEGDYDLESERARLAHHQANKAALEEELVAGNLHRAEDVRSVFTDMVMACRAKLMGMPTKLAPQLPACRDEVEMQDLLKKAVFEALTELSDYDREEIVERYSNSKRRK